jgi:acetoin utilization deacetylase AcuC-like enzyme
MEHLKQSGLINKLQVLQPREAREEELLLVHTSQHIALIRELSKRGGIIDVDTRACEETWRVAKLAAGGCIVAAEKVMVGEVDNCFALVRPPGHHATRDKAMGFCFFNNISIMINYLRKEFGLKKVFIFDWDAHAGNGTMEIFYDDSHVLNISIHQDPTTLYPGVGFITEMGRGEGEGFTVNIPVAPHASDADYLYIINEFVSPLVKRFQPDFVAISCGLDSHRMDPISSLSLTEKGYGKMTEEFLSLAEQICNGRLVMVLEGGYELSALCASVYEILSSLIESREIKVEGEVKESTYSLVESLKRRWQNV